MAETKKLYTLADILGEPITEQEAQNLIRKETNSDEQTFQNYVNLNETYRNKLLHFIMGKNGDKPLPLSLYTLNDPVSSSITKLPHTSFLCINAY